MIAVLTEWLPDGTHMHVGMVQVAAHQGIPVLEPAHWKGGRSRDDLSTAVADARRAAKTSKHRFPPLRAEVAVQRSKPPGRTVYSGLVKVGLHRNVAVFERAAGLKERARRSDPSYRPFFWPESADQAVAAAQQELSA